MEADRCVSPAFQVVTVAVVAATVALAAEKVAATVGVMVVVETVGGRWLQAVAAGGRGGAKVAAGGKQADAPTAYTSFGVGCKTPLARMHAEVGKLNVTLTKKRGQCNVTLHCPCSTCNITSKLQL